MSRQNLFDCLAGAQFFQNVLDSDTGATDNRFAHHHLRIALDEVVRGFHCKITSTTQASRLLDHASPSGSTAPFAALLRLGVPAADGVHGAERLFSSVQGLSRLPKASYRESYC